MIKQKTVLEIEVNERTYSFECDPSSPLGEIFDVLTQMKAFVVQKINESEVVKEEKSDG